MLAKQYGHMKIVALMDTHLPSLPKSLYRSPGTCTCQLHSAGVCGCLELQHISKSVSPFMRKGRVADVQGLSSPTSLAYSKLSRVSSFFLRVRLSRAPSLVRGLFHNNCSGEKYEDLSSSDESCPAPQRQRPCRKKGVSIHEGPRALARITGIALGGRAPRCRYAAGHLPPQQEGPPVFQPLSCEHWLVTAWAGHAEQQSLPSEGSRAPAAA
ncbi:hypothetical protein P7K49_022921 [Saguinus oedipus]|uniref:Uncharacterized protein n=1 Tax=Saguinus oedipus TaxID=9490 RepID=A0ABQ9UL14_SAGOE|nr:hypothetical protein P7K49_022921 [Saguinus oedipus]